MRVDLIEVPYDSGHRGLRMGAGPRRLVEGGLVQALEQDGNVVRQRRVEADVPFPAEVATAFALQRLTGSAVAGARAGGAFPLVLSGNCNIAAIGATAGLGGTDAAVIWLDAHADCETPETTESGFLDGMGVAMLLGRCWTTALAAVPGFRPLPGDRFALLGTRQVSAAESALLDDAGALHMPADRCRAAGIRDNLAPLVARWRSQGVRHLYVHLDLDVLDPSIAPANSYAEPGGLSVEEVRDAIAVAAAGLPIGAAALTAFDPSCDVDDRMLGAARDLAQALVRDRSYP